MKATKAECITFPVFVEHTIAFPHTRWEENCKQFSALVPDEDVDSKDLALSVCRYWRTAGKFVHLIKEPVGNDPCVVPQDYNEPKKERLYKAFHKRATK